MIILLMIITYLIFLFIMSVMTDMLDLLELQLLLAIILLMITLTSSSLHECQDRTYGSPWLLYSCKLAPLCTFSTNGIGEILPLTLPSES